MLNEGVDGFLLKMSSLYRGKNNNNCLEFSGNRFLQSTKKDFISELKRY